MQLGEDNILPQIFEPFFLWCVIAFVTHNHHTMWAVVTELLFSFVLLAFLVISCQNVLHIASNSVRSVLACIHTQLDRELGEDEGVADEEENVTTRVVRRRVILKVQRGRTNNSNNFEEKLK